MAVGREGPTEYLSGQGNRISLYLTWMDGIIRMVRLCIPFLYLSLVNGV